MSVITPQQRSQVGLFVFVITMSAMAIAGAGYLMGKPTLDWLVVVITSGLASLATAWRPGSQTVEPAPVEVTAASAPFVYPTATGPNAKTPPDLTPLNQRP